MQMSAATELCPTSSKMQDTRVRSLREMASQILNTQPSKSEQFLANGLMESVHAIEQLQHDLSRETNLKKIETRRCVDLRDELRGRDSRIDDLEHEVCALIKGQEQK